MQKIMPYRCLKMKLVGMLALGLFLGFKASAIAGENNEPLINASDSTVYFSGANIKEDAFYSYSGIVHALSGDLLHEGFLLRGVFGYGEYDYGNGNVVSNRIEGEVLQFDLTIGYQIYRADTRLTGYVGINYQDHDLSPQDLQNSTRGDEVGFLVQGEIETVLARSLNASMIANYSTANDTYWTRIRVGRKLDRFTIGPEVTLMGNDEYDGQRIGAFLSGFDLGFLNATVSGGYADVNGTQGDASVYGSIGFSHSF